MTSPRADATIRSTTVAAAVDTHVHVFDPARFPYHPARSYTPGEATLAELRRRQAGWGANRTVLVQPSVYGDDNACLLAAIAALGTDTARGIAVVDLAHTSAAEIDALHEAGVRGLRLNLRVAPPDEQADQLAQLEAVAARFIRRDWCMQVHAPASALPILARRLSGLRVPLVLDHFAGLKPRAPDFAAHCDRLMDLLATGKVYVKLSAPYRMSSLAPDFVDLEPLVRRLVAVRPDRLLWGSDWPHTGGDGLRQVGPDQIEAFRAVDVPAILRALERWAGTEAVLRQILVTNAERLYGFQPVDRA